jgi:hypothetical protein
MKPELDMPVGKLDRYQAIVDIIERPGPRMLAWDGGKLVREGESLIDAATYRALALDSSALFIQGPPGTGKTYTSAHVILSLIAVGKRVGVSSNSHKAINNLLAQIEQVAAATGTIFSGVKKVSRNDPDSYLKGRMIADIESNEDVETGGYDLIGGTAWLFARSGMDQRLDGRGGKEHHPCWRPDAAGPADPRSASRRKRVLDPRLPFAG